MSLGKTNEFLLEEILFFGYEEEGEFNEEFSEIPPEDFYQMQSIQGMILRFNDGQEIIVDSDGWNDVFLRFEKEKRVTFGKNSLGWKMKIRHVISN